MYVEARHHYSKTRGLSSVLNLRTSSTQVRRPTSHEPPSVAPDKRQWALVSTPHWSYRAAIPTPTWWLRRPPPRSRSGADPWARTRSISTRAVVARIWRRDRAGHGDGAPTQHATAITNGRDSAASPGGFSADTSLRLSLPTSQILLRYPSPFNVNCGILSVYTIEARK